ncbi:MAG: DUF455 domain-containing protein, partial [Planktomarina sp.]
MTTLTDLAVEVLNTSDGCEKTAVSRRNAALWFEHRQAGTDLGIGTATPPDMPARPTKPELLSPRDVPRRKPGTVEGR